MHQDYNSIVVDSIESLRALSDSLFFMLYVEITLNPIHVVAITTFVIASGLLLLDTIQKKYHHLSK